MSKNKAARKPAIDPEEAKKMLRDSGYSVRKMRKKTGKPRGRPPNEIDHSTPLGQFALSMRRIRDGKSVDEMVETCERAGIPMHASTWYSYERGQEAPPFERMVDIYRAFGRKLATELKDVV